MALTELCVTTSEIKHDISYNMNVTDRNYDNNQSRLSSKKTTAFCTVCKMIVSLFIRMTACGMFRNGRENRARKWVKDRHVDTSVA